MKSSKKTADRIYRSQEARISSLSAHSASSLCVCAIAAHGGSHNTPQRPRCRMARAYIHTTTTSDAPSASPASTSAPAVSTAAGTITKGGATEVRDDGHLRGVLADLPAAGRRQRRRSTSRGVDGPSCPTGRRRRRVRDRPQLDEFLSRTGGSTAPRELGRLYQDPHNRNTSKKGWDQRLRACWSHMRTGTRTGASRTTI